MEIKLIEHEDTAWVRKVEITHEGKTYRLTIGWDSGDGYQMYDGWDELPEDLQNEYEDEYGLVSALDEMTFAQAYNKEESK
jgi:hypothetical protein